MTVIETVKKRLSLPTDAALARLLKVNRSCIWDWRKRLFGSVPSRHWSALVDEAKRQKKSLTIEDLTGA